MISDFDRYLFHEGTNTQVYKMLGAHPCNENGTDGAFFAVWAPHAESVGVITGATGWNASSSQMKINNGIWELFVPGVKKGDNYRFEIVGADGITRYKSDPYALYTELRPGNASLVWDIDNFSWTDSDYINGIDTEKLREKPMAIYEVHPGSWKKDYRCGKDGFIGYRRFADELTDYIKYMGYTHIELIGICEHPFDGSWGYQVTGYFSPTSRYGSPEDFKYLVNKMHENGIGVILDWVPAHFPKDSFGLEKFDGSYLYESDDPLLREYPEWSTNAFDHSKPEVRSFLISSAFYWINEFHVDALRVDAVAAMLYTNFSRAKWRPNKFGGTENLESMAFLKKLNSLLRAQTKGYLIAEDSSAMQGITESTKKGGFGFLFKWNMGWMNDTLRYFGKDPLFRGFHHGEVVHTAEYAFSENFILVLSHDEVVHLKHSMFEKMPGTTEDKFGSLKCLYSMQFTFPGKKLLFMGQDFGMEREWSENRAIDWELADDKWHRDIMECVRGLLALYRKYPCLYSDTGNRRTFEWINSGDAMRSTFSYIRRNPWNYNGALVVISNCTPIPLPNYTFGVPSRGVYKRVFSTYDSLPDSNKAVSSVTAEKRECDGRKYTAAYDLRPYETVIFEVPFTERKKKNQTKMQQK